MPTINYIASPTGARFHASNKIVRGFLGPVGNGKSVCCINEMHRLSVLQEPNCDGIRKTKWAIVRNTYDMLETTTLATFRAMYSIVVLRKYRFTIFNRAVITHYHYVDMIFSVTS